MPARALTSRGQFGRQKIVEAAWPLFYERGIHATSVDDILKAAGMGKSQFYHYFPTKEHLVCEVVDFQINRILGYLAPFTQRIQKVEDLQPWFEAYVQLAKLNQCRGCPVGVIAAEAAVASPVVQERVILAFHKWCSLVTETLTRLKAQGEFLATFDPDAGAEFMATCVQGSLLLTRTFRDADFLRRTFHHAFRYLATQMTPESRIRAEKILFS